MKGGVWVLPMFLGGLASGNAGTGVPWAAPDTTFVPRLSKPNDVITTWLIAFAHLCSSQPCSDFAGANSLLFDQPSHRGSGLIAIGHRAKSGNPDEVVAAFLSVPEQVDWLSNGALGLIRWRATGC